MLCSTCGSKVQSRGDMIFCKTCDSEFDFFDVEDGLIPEPTFVVVQLNSQYVIIDTRKQASYAIIDRKNKAELISHLLNKNLAERELSKLIKNN